MYKTKREQRPDAAPQGSPRKRETWRRLNRHHAEILKTHQREAAQMSDETLAALRKVIRLHVIFEGANEERMWLLEKK